MSNELKSKLLNSLEMDNWIIDDLTQSLKTELQNQLKFYYNSPLSINVSNYFLKTDFTDEEFKDLTFPLVPNELNNRNGVFDFFLSNLKYQGNDLSLQIAYLEEENHFKLFQSIKKIETYYPKFQSMINDLNLFICFFRGAHFLSTSNPKILGTIFLNEQIFEKPEELDLTIVHELAHQELFLLNMVDLLIDKEMINNLSHARFQGYKRPPIGRFHSLHSIYRMTKYSELCDHPLFATLIKEFAAAIEDLNINELSLLGKKMYKRIYMKYLEDLQKRMP